MNSKPYLAAGSVLAVLALASCSEAGTEPDPFRAQAAAAVAAVSADALLEDLNAMDDATPGIGGLPEHVVRERVVTFYDENGQEQEEHDPVTTASIHAIVTIEGEIARDNISGSVERHRDTWVTGLLGEEETRTFNGEGSGEHEHVRISDEFGEQIRSVESSSVTDDVVRSVDRENQPWPLSGTITRHVEVTITNGPNGDATRERTSVIVFDGTQFATMTVGDQVHEVDLAAREGHNPLRPRRP